MSLRKLSRAGSGKYAKVATQMRRLDQALDLTERYARMVERRLSARVELFGDASVLPADEMEALGRASRVLRALREAKILF